MEESPLPSQLFPRHTHRRVPRESGPRQCQLGHPSGLAHSSHPSGRQLREPPGGQVEAEASLASLASPPETQTQTKRGTSPHPCLCVCRAFYPLGHLWLPQQGTRREQGPHSEWGLGVSAFTRVPDPGAGVGVGHRLGPTPQGPGLPPAISPQGGPRCLPSLLRDAQGPVGIVPGPPVLSRAGTGVTTALVHSHGLKGGPSRQLPSSWPPLNPAGGGAAQRQTVFFLFSPAQTEFN